MKLSRQAGFKMVLLQFLYQGQLRAVTTIEYEPGLKKDFPEMLARIAPSEIIYEHDNTWHDGNGHSHVRASLLGPSLTVPFKNKSLMLGTWRANSIARDGY